MLSKGCKRELPSDLLGWRNQCMRAHKTLEESMGHSQYVVRQIIYVYGALQNNGGGINRIWLMIRY